MNSLIVYKEIAPQLAAGTAKGYRAGLAAMVRLNKQKILKLADPSAEGIPLRETPLRFAQDDKPPLFKISYTGTDEQLLRNFEVEAFTVAGVMQYECEEKLKAMARSLLDGTHPYLQAHPESSIDVLWRDEAYNILGDYMDVPDMPPPSYLQTNLQTAVNSAYHASQWQRLQELKDVYSAYQYKTREDDRVREEHAVLDNLVADANDPIWDKIWPPNGWNCRCYINPLSDDEMTNISEDDRLGLTDSEGRDGLLQDAKIEPAFQLNSGESESIWGKWLNSKMRDIDFGSVTKTMRDYADSLNLEEETWGNYKSIGDTQKISIKIDGDKITVKTGDKEIEDIIGNIDKYRRGVLMTPKDPG